jgi:GST-like protein
MIDLYTWTTPNGYKALIAFEEFGLPRKLHWIDIGKGEQRTAAYVAINPNSKIPAIVDPDGPGGKLAIFESGAILTYLAERTGNLLAKTGAERYRTLEWLHFQNAGIGPMMGQLGHFVKFAKEKIPYAIERYTDEVKRLFEVLDDRLAAASYLAGEIYTIADISTFPWVRNGAMLGLEMSAYPNVQRWIGAIDAREAVKRALAMKP